MLLFHADTITENNSFVQIFYNSTDSSLQCKFQGHAYEVEWYLILAYVDIYQYRYLDTYDLEFQLGLGNQYHQSTIQATNLENGYTNELTIVSGFAPCDLYGCVAITDNSRHHSDVISTCKLTTKNLILVCVNFSMYSSGFFIRE